MLLDPVCGKSVTRRGNRFTAEYAGETYAFCSSACLTRFDEEPDVFTAGTGVGQLANADRGVDPVKNPGRGSHAELEQPSVDAGPG